MKMMLNKNELKVLDNMDLTGVRNPALIQLQTQRRLTRQLKEQFGQDANTHIMKLLGKGADDDGDRFR